MTVTARFHTYLLAALIVFYESTNDMTDWPSMVVVVVF